MMVNCPKCGFSQPGDQYCARCGIDMVTYQPVKKPLVGRVIRSTYFQLCTLMIVIAVVIFVAKEAHQREVSERQSDIDNAQNSQIMVKTGDRSAASKRSEFASAAPTTAPASVGDTPPLAPTTLSDSGAKNLNAAADSTAVALSPNPATGPDEAKANARASNLSVSFYEMPRGASAELVNAADRRLSQLQGEQGAFNIGVLPAFASKMKSLSASGGIDALDTSSRALKISDAIEFYGGQREDSTGQFLGFVVEAVPTQMDENETHLQVRVFRYLRDTNGQVEEFSVPMPEQITVPHGGGVFVSGSFLLPRRASEADRRFYDPLKVLHLLAKDDFLKGLTDFVITIDPR